VLDRVPQRQSSVLSDSLDQRVTTAEEQESWAQEAVRVASQPELPLWLLLILICLCLPVSLLLAFLGYRERE